jgi:hydrogenase maturation protease
MVELGRALGRLPERLVVVGVEGECWDHGAPLSPAVAAVVPDAVARVCDLLEASSRKEPGDVPQ